MVNFSNRDKEILSDAGNLVREKVTAIGADGYGYSEPFVRSPVIPLSQVMRNTPDGYNNNLGLTTPNYDDFPVEGAIGMRRVEVKLHSYIPSGLNGPDSCQSFFAISSDPLSNHADDLELVRIKPLISSSFSPRKTNAANSDTFLRGFELALYPAKMAAPDSSGVLEADTTNGSISPLADPGASSSSDAGAGSSSDGFWSVDYENGIVRFSRPPVNGSAGVMNPNNVFSDLDGDTGVGDGYAITMFATYYEYVGEFGTTNDPDFVTVGDGYVSTGQFIGASFNVLQAAIDSLPGEGGTIFIKEGQYDFVDSVVIPPHVNVVGLNGVTIIRPRREPAFIMSDGYSSLEGVEIHGRDGVSNGGAIELRSTTVSQTIRQITIKNNVIYAENDAPGISIAPILATPTYLGLDISNNIFKPNTANPVYIGETNRGTTATIRHSKIENNDFQPNDIGASTAISFPGTVVTKFEVSSIKNNDATNSDIILDMGTDIMEHLVISGNRIENLEISAISESIIADNIVDNDMEIGFSIVTGDGITVVDRSSIIDNVMLSLEIGPLITGSGGGLILDNSKISGNNLSSWISLGSVGRDEVTTTYQDSLITDNNIESGLVTSGRFTDCKISENRINSSSNFDSFLRTSIHGNIFDGNFNIGLEVSAGDGTVIGDSQIIDNIIKGAVDIGGGVDGATAGLVLDNSTFSGNKISSSVQFGAGSRNEVTTTYQDSIISNNKITTTFTLSGRTADCNVLGNQIEGNFLIDAILRTTIGGNNLSGNCQIGNQILSTEGTVVDDSHVIDNIVVSTFTIGSGITGSGVGLILDNSKISGNNALSTFSIGSGSRDEVTTTHQDSIISNNKVDSTFTVGGRIADCSILGNQFKGLFIINAILRTTINDNNIGGNCVIGDSVLTTDGTAIDNSVITNNLVTGNGVFASDITGSGSGLILDNSTISGNKLLGLVELGSVSRNETTLTYKDSTISDNIITSTLDVSGRMDACQFTGNSVIDTAAFDSIFSTKISDGYFGGAVTIANGMTSGTCVGESIIDSNVMSSTLDIGNSITTGNILDDSIFSDNNIAGAVSVGTALTDTKAGLIFNESVFNGNQMDGTVTFAAAARSTVTTTYQDSTISGNTFVSLFVSSGRHQESVISGNNFKLIAKFDSIWQTIISNNLLGGGIDIGVDVTSGEGTVVFGSTIANNFLFGSFSIGTSVITGTVLLDANISGNVVSSLLTIGSTSANEDSSLHGDSIISDNKVGSSFTLSGRANDCIISGNNFEGAFAVDGITRTIISNNSLGSTGDFGNDIAAGGSVVVINKSTIANNIITGAVVIGSGITDFGAALVFDDSKLDGNILLSSLTMSAVTRNKTTATYQNSIISENIIESSFILHGAKSNVNFIGNIAASGDGYGGQISGIATNGHGFESVGVGTGFGLIARAEGSGYGILAQADITTPVKSSLRLVPQDTEPSNPLEGDIFVHGEGVGGAFKIFLNGSWKTITIT